ncbi:MAG: NAD(P)/FAD-dependent oxidoreductase [Anaerolineales bacterium]
MSLLFDVAVVGGGPAGSSAAIVLAGLGARVALLESKTYPHDKLCGEFLSPECAGLLDRLGVLPALHCLNPVSIETVCLTTPDGTLWETRLPGTALGLSRRALDATLAERATAAGAEVRQATTVTNICGNLREGFEMMTRSTHGEASVRARAVIAAHGKRAALDRALNRRFLQKRQPFVALKAHFHGPPLPGRIELHAFSGGYCGMSEFEGGLANVCLLAHESIFRQAAAPGPVRLNAFIGWMQSQNARLGSWLSRARRVDPEWLSIGQVPFGDKRPVVNDVLMAGDAAGLIAPLAGDGIAMALRGGALAAAHVARFLQGQFAADELCGGYASAWRREFAPRLRLGRFLQIFMLRPRWLSFGLRLIRAVPPLGRYVVTHTRDVRLQT